MAGCAGVADGAEVAGGAVAAADAVGDAEASGLTVLDGVAAPLQAASRIEMANADTARRGWTRMGLGLLRGDQTPTRHIARSQYPRRGERVRDVSVDADVTVGASG